MRPPVAVIVIALVSLPVVGEECPNRYPVGDPDGVEVWGCFEGDPYWDIEVFGGDRPLVSGGTLFVPTKDEPEVGMGGRIVNRAVDSVLWQVESNINHTVDEAIYETMKKVF